MGQVTRSIFRGLQLSLYWMAIGGALLIGCTPTPKPSLQINLSPTQLTLTQGESQEVTISLMRHNLPGLVVLETEDPLPIGISITFTPSSTLGNTSTLRVEASSSAAVGRFTLRIKASQGSISQGIELPIEVKQALAPSLNISLNNPTPTIRQGEYADLLVEVVKVNTGGTVVLSLEQQDGSPLPAGLSATFSPSQPGSSISILRLSVTTAASLGSYPLRIKASLGSLERTLDFTLTVLPASEEPSFQISLRQDLSLQRGHSLEETITLTRSNLTGPIALSLERLDGTPLPADLRATFSPATVTDSSATLTLSAAPSLPLGNYILRVRGEQGALVRTATVLLNVYDYAELSPTGTLWVAGQDNSGAWQVVLSSEGKYRLRVGNAAERYGWAVVCSRSEGSTTTYLVQVFQLTLSEVHSLSLSCPAAASPGTFSNLSGQLSGLGGSYGLVAYGTASDFVDPARTSEFPPTPAYPGYLLEGVRHGTADLMALRYVLPSSPGTVFEADRAVFERSYPVGGPQTLNLDTQGPNSFALEGSYTATLTNPNPEALGLSHLAYLTPTTQTLYLANSQQRAGSLSYRAIPETRRQPGEFYLFYARETSFSNLSLRARQAVRGIANPQNLSVDFLSPLEASLTLLDNRFKASWSPGYTWLGSGTRLFSLQLAQLAVAPGTHLEWHLQLSQGWLAGESSYTLPDLAQSCAAAQSPCAPAASNTPANGWQAAWDLRGDLELNWSLSAVEVSLPLPDWLPLTQSTVPPPGISLDGFRFGAASEGGIYNASALSALRLERTSGPRLLPFWLSPR